MRYRAEGAPVWEEIDPIVDPISYLIDLDLSTTYEFQARTACSTTTTDWSDTTYTFVTLESGPAGCGNPVPVSLEESFFTALIQLEESTDAIAYRIRYRVVGEFDWEAVESVYPLLLLTFLSDNTDYEYQLGVHCPYGWTEWSGETYLFHHIGSG